jgi:hypothetical protein
MGLPLFSPDSAMVIDGGRLSWKNLSDWICRSTKVRGLLDFRKLSWAASSEAKL